MTNKIYSGIGSRTTPPEVLTIMESLGARLASSWVLRSGYADGADKAFFKGANAHYGQMEMYLPWKGFNWALKTDARFIVPTMNDALLDFAAQYHPAWDNLSQGSKYLIARNGCQVLGEDLSTPSNMVVCWTPAGQGGGGTGQALRIARAYNIPIFDLGLSDELDRLNAFLNQ